MPDFGLEVGNVLRADQFMINGGNRVLPQQLLLGNFRAEITRDRAHVTVGQLVPGSGKGICESAGFWWKRLEIFS